MERLAHPFLLTVGALSVVLAAAGLFLPLVPTTPFLLLAAFCFSKSSPRAHRWLHENRWFGKYLRDYEAGLGIPLLAKVFILSSLWFSIGGSALFLVPVLWGKILLLLLASAVTIHILMITTRRASN